jgi:transposase
MNKKKQYTWEFKQNAVRLATMPGKTITTVAIELGVPSWRIRNWIKESKENLERSSDIDEIIRLQQKVKSLEEENEILKKAAAYFAKTLL